MTCSRIPIIARMIERGGVKATWYSATPCKKARYTVVNETCKLIPRSYVVDDYCVLKGKESIIGATVDWSQPNTAVKTGTVVVKDETGAITYTITTDYTVDYAAGEVSLADGSRIRPRATILVSYEWYQPCVNPETGNPRIDCPVCDGRGVTYSDRTEVIGLLDIPKYDSTLTKVGFFEMGDAIFTTSSLYLIKAKGVGNDHLFTRDILVINDGVNNQIWRVLSKPETIQLANEYLAHKVHIRKIREGETLIGLSIGV